MTSAVVELFVHIYENNKSLLNVEEFNTKLIDTFLTLAKNSKKAMQVNFIYLINFLPVSLNFLLSFALVIIKVWTRINKLLERNFLVMLTLTEFSFQARQERNFNEISWKTRSKILERL